MSYEAVVIGTSAGGLSALKMLFSHINKNYYMPALIVQHMHPNSKDIFASHFSDVNHLTFKEADEKETIKKKHVYIAPANYHMMVERNKSLAFTIDEKIHFCRPAIDILFESAVEVYGKRLIGIILTGGNSDGSLGLLKIKKAGGLTIVQDPATAEVNTMPLSVIKLFKPDYILKLKDIGELLSKINN